MTGTVYVLGAWAKPGTTNEPEYVGAAGFENVIEVN
jgi:hypothetical protein